MKYLTSSVLWVAFLLLAGGAIVLEPLAQPANFDGAMYVRISINDNGKNMALDFKRMQGEQPGAFSDAEIEFQPADSYIPSGWRVARSIGQYWRIIPVKSLQRPAPPTALDIFGGTRKPQSAYRPEDASKYKIVNDIEGAWRTLSMDAYGKVNVKLASNSDRGQLWDVIPQSDGTYRLVNALAAETFQSGKSSLFYDYDRRDVFVSSWVEGKTLNGRFTISNISPISEARWPNEFSHGSGYYLVDPQTNKRYCGVDLYSDIYLGSELAPCGIGKDPDTWFFKRNLDGTYFIYASSSSRTRSLYGNLIESTYIDELNPESGGHFNIQRVGSYYKIIDQRSRPTALERSIKTSSSYNRNTGQTQRWQSPFAAFAPVTNGSDQYWILQPK